MTFFRAVDAAKPSPEELMRRLSIKDRKSLEYVRASEAAVIETIDQAARRRSAQLH
jgi:hypothetical protein